MPWWQENPVGFLNNRREHTMMNENEKQPRRLLNAAALRISAFKLQVALA
jgi:hypothetical protein